MPISLTMFLATLSSILRSRAALQLENLALRHQIGVLQHSTRRRPRLTPVDLQLEFVYLAVLLDAFSRRCLGWALRRSLEAALALEALRMALRHRRPKPGLVHHSDRGVQYASQDYATELQQHGIRISMSRTASPYDNAQAESFIKTLKYEEVYRTEYRSLEDARASIGEFLEKIYNRERLHSALGYRPPLEFERHLRRAQAMGRGQA